MRKLKLLTVMGLSLLGMVPASNAAGFMGGGTQYYSNPGMFSPYYGQPYFPQTPYYYPTVGQMPMQPYPPMYPQMPPMAFGGQPPIMPNPGIGGFDQAGGPGLGGAPGSMSGGPGQSHSRGAYLF